MVFADEFNYQGRPNPKYWGYEVEGNGSGNNEKAFYTDRPENSYVDGEHLVIEARKEKYQHMEYTSARVTSQGRIAWKYGRFDVRAKLTSGRGTWPAIWMMGDKAVHSEHLWPDNGEIDILEHVGHKPDEMLSTLHTKGRNWMKKNQPDVFKTVPNLETEFHVFSLVWDENLIETFIDGEKVLSYPNEGKGWETWPFDHPFFMQFNVAIGGNWGGKEGIDDSIFPQKMLIDYLRVYQRDSR